MKYVTVALATVCGFMLGAIFAKGGSHYPRVDVVLDGNEMAVYECLPNGKFHGQAWRYRGHLRTWSRFVDGMPVEAVEYSEAGEVLSHVVEGPGYSLIEK